MEKLICINMTCPLRLRCNRYSGALDFTGDYYVVEWFYPVDEKHYISCEHFVALEAGVVANDN